MVNRCGLRQGTEKSNYRIAHSPQLNNRISQCIFRCYDSVAAAVTIFSYLPWSKCRLLSLNRGLKKLGAFFTQIYLLQFSHTRLFCHCRSCKSVAFGTLLFCVMYHQCHGGPTLWTCPEVILRASERTLCDFPAYKYNWPVYNIDKRGDDGRHI